MLKRLLSTRASNVLFVVITILVVAAFGFAGRFVYKAKTSVAAQGPPTIAEENDQYGAPRCKWDLGVTCPGNCNFTTGANCTPSPIQGADLNGDPSIQGFATDISYARGQEVVFKVKTTASSYRIDIYRMGYYRGAGAGLKATLNVTTNAAQNSGTQCGYTIATGLVDCSNWAPSEEWLIPANAASGIYFAKLVRLDDENKASHVVFVVRDDEGRSDILFQTSDTTWQAYNVYSDGRGNKGLYYNDDWANTIPAQSATERHRAYKVSYNRPFNSRGSIATSEGTHSWVFNTEYPMVRWLEANGYDVSYFTGVDSERSGSEILEHKLFLSVGHDEYWSGQQRANVEAARDAQDPVHLAFFSGNEVFWKTRWENNHRTLVCYKETNSNAKIDPDQNVWTGTWRDARFSPPADGGRPENALIGTLFTVAPDNQSGVIVDSEIEVTCDDLKLRLWRNTAIASTAPCVQKLAKGTLGFEWNSDLDNGSRPAGLFRLSSTTKNITGRLLKDEGSLFGSGTATHHMTLHRRTSGALVFSAGTIQWPWGLDCDHDRPTVGCTPDVSMQQATVNLFADMDVQPNSIQTGLTLATKSTDTTAPAAPTISSLTANATVFKGRNVVIAGSAADSGGGLVGGVEVSVDGGTTWLGATGRENWIYIWVPGPSAPSAVTIKARATDDSGNTGPAATVSVVVAPDQQGPFFGTPIKVPGTIEATDFDFGGEGVGYHDLTPANEALATYRPPPTGVDIGACAPGLPCDYLIGYVRQGEWLVYSIDVTEAGQYTLEAQCANDVGGGTFHVEINGNNVTGPMLVPDTNDGWVMGTVSKTLTVHLSAGTTTMKVHMDMDAGNGWVGNFKSFKLKKNMALSQNGATSQASSSFPGYSHIGAIDGDRKGLNGGNNGYWSSASGSLPQSIEVDFGSEKTINEIDIFTPQDNYQSPQDPTLAMTFTLYGIINFDVQYWSGSSWTNVPGGQVMGNNHVWKKLNFPLIKTSKIRVVVHTSADGWARLTELEVWGSNALQHPEVVWSDDAVPAGATAGASDGDAWNWITSNPTSFSGTSSHQSNLDPDFHQHFFLNPSSPLAVTAGDKLITYVYLDPVNPPCQILLGWYDGNWDHRAYWGADKLPYGINGTTSRRYMGPLPPVGRWVRLEVPASQVGLEGSNLNGMVFALYAGRATWDRVGKIAP